MNNSEIVSVQKPLKILVRLFYFVEFGTLTDLGGTDSGVLASWWL